MKAIYWIWHQTTNAAWGLGFLISGQCYIWKTLSDKYVSLKWGARAFCFFVYKKTYSSNMDFLIVSLWLRPFFVLRCINIDHTRVFRLQRRKQCVQVQAESHTALSIACPSLWNQDQSKPSPGHNRTISCLFSHYCAYLPGERDAAWKVNVPNIVAVSH